MVALLLALVATGWLRKDRVQIGAQTRATAMAIDRALSFGDTNALLASIYYRRAEDEQFKPVLAEFYRSLDPTNTMNPGIGQTSTRRDWR